MAELVFVKTAGAFLPGRKAPWPNVVAWLLKIMWKLAPALVLCLRFRKARGQAGCWLGLREVTRKD